MGTPSNILSGPARLFVCTAPSATNEPFGVAGTFAIPVTASQNIYVEAGFLEDGVEMTYAPTILDVQSDHELLDVRRFLTQEKITFKANLQEATLRNWQLAMAGNSGNAIGGDITAEGVGANPAFAKLQMGKKSVFSSGPPALGGVMRELAVCFTGRNPSYVGVNTENLGVRVVYMHKCTAHADIAAKFYKNGVTIIPVEFTAMLLNTESFACVEIYDVTTDEPFLPAAPFPLVL